MTPKETEAIPEALKQLLSHMRSSDLRITLPEALTSMRTGFLMQLLIEATPDQFPGEGLELREIASELLAGTPKSSGYALVRPDANDSINEPFTAHDRVVGLCAWRRHGHSMLPIQREQDVKTIAQRLEHERQRLDRIERGRRAGAAFHALTRSLAEQLRTIANGKGIDPAVRTEAMAYLSQTNPQIRECLAAAEVLGVVVDLKLETAPQS